MTRISFDLDVLRSFVAGIDLGSYAKAANHVGRSTSAVSSQLKKLEDQAGTAIFHRAGRGLALTEAGETMLAYARRLIALNDEAASAVAGESLNGRLRVGLQQDFGETLLPAVLARFARAHPMVRIEVHIARNGELLDRLARDQLDVALAWDDGAVCAQKQPIARLNMRWIGPRAINDNRGLENEGPISLVCLDAMCLFRNAGLSALDRVGRPWRIAFTSSSLAGVWAGVTAGFGVTVRSAIGLPTTVKPLDETMLGLPALPDLGIALYSRDIAPDPASTRLGILITDEIRTMMPTT